MKIKETLKKVRYILENDYASRDNDRILIWSVWEKDKEKGSNEIDIINSITKKEFLNSDNLSDVITIRRCRQILQHANPLLRGNTYEARHHKAEKVKKEIKEETFKAILNSKYTRITKEIFKTIKKGDFIYYTHKDSLLYGMNVNTANDELILGTKYIVTGTTIASIAINGMYYNPGQFSILELIESVK